MDTKLKNEFQQLIRQYVGDDKEFLGKVLKLAESGRIEKDPETASRLYQLAQRRVGDYRKILTDVAKLFD